MSKNSNELRDAQKTLCDAAHKFANSDLVAGTWGNLSMRINDDYFVCTPSGRDYNELEPKDMPIVKFGDLSYEGPKPTKEKNFHAMIYQERDEINAIIHTHSMNASTVAAARRDVPPVLDDQAQILGPNIRCAEYGLPGTKNIAKKVVKAIKGRNACLLANHGAVVIGRDLDEAFTGCAVLEKACKAFIEAEFIGGPVPLRKF